MIHLSHNDTEFSYCDGSSYLAHDVLITQSDYDDNLTFQFAIKMMELWWVVVYLMLFARCST